MVRPAGTRRAKFEPPWDWMLGDPDSPEEHDPVGGPNPEGGGHVESEIGGVNMTDSGDEIDVVNVTREENSDVDVENVSSGSEYVPSVVDEAEEDGEPDGEVGEVFENPRARKSEAEPKADQSTGEQSTAEREASPPEEQATEERSSDQQLPFVRLHELNCSLFGNSL